MSTVGLELTNSCPWRCETCLPASGLPRVGELGPTQWCDLFYSLARFDYDAVCFSGGEPLTHPAIVELLGAAADTGLGVSLFTSGSGLDDRVLAALLGAGAEVVVSLDGADRTVHDRSRGPGSFDTAVDALRRLDAAGARTSVSCTVTRRNRHLLDALPGLVAGLGAGRVSFNEVVRGGRARSHWPSLGLDSAARVELRRWFLRSAPGWPGGSGTAPGTDESCWVDGSSLYITSQGRCYICSEVAQFRPRNWAGTVTGDRGPDAATIERIRTAELSACSCRYETVVSGPYLLVLDSPRPCVGLDWSAATGGRTGHTLDAERGG